LHRAAFEGHLDVAKLLLHSQADVNAVADKKSCGNNSTPLLLAARASHPDMVELLLEAGSEVNARNDMGWIPLVTVGLWYEQEVETGPEMCYSLCEQDGKLVGLSLAGCEVLSIQSPKADQQAAGLQSDIADALGIHKGLVTVLRDGHCLEPDDLVTASQGGLTVKTSGMTKEVRKELSIQVARLLVERGAEQRRLHEAAQEAEFRGHTSLAKFLFDAADRSGHATIG